MVTWVKSCKQLSKSTTLMGKCVQAVPGWHTPSQCRRGETEKVTWEDSLLYATWQPCNCNPNPPTSQLHPGKLVLGFPNNTVTGVTQAKAWCFSASASTYSLSGCTEIWKNLPGHCCLPLLSKFNNDIKDETRFTLLLNLLPKFCEKIQPCVFQLYEK